jgi:hypothetical protein
MLRRQWAMIAQTISSSRFPQLSRLSSQKLKFFYNCSPKLPFNEVISPVFRPSFTLYYPPYFRIVQSESSGGVSATLQGQGYAPPFLRPLFAHFTHFTHFTNFIHFICPTAFELMQEKQDRTMPLSIRLDKTGTIILATFW